MKQSDKHICYSIVVMLMLAFFISAMCMFFAANDRSMVSYILFGITGVMVLAQVIAAIVYACRKDKNSMEELQLSYQVVALVLLVVILCVPIFFIWVVEKIHDAVSYKHRENIL